MTLLPLTLRSGPCLVICSCGAATSLRHGLCFAPPPEAYHTTANEQAHTWISNRCCSRGTSQGPR